jgi:hypothetical protein
LAHFHTLPADRRPPDLLVLLEPDDWLPSLGDRSRQASLASLMALATDAFAWRDDAHHPAPSAASAPLPHIPSPPFRPPLAAMAAATPATPAASFNFVGEPVPPDAAPWRGCDVLVVTGAEDVASVARRFARFAVMLRVEERRRATDAAAVAFRFTLTVLAASPADCVSFFAAPAWAPEPAARSAVWDPIDRDEQPRLTLYERTGFVGSDDTILLDPT